MKRQFLPIGALSAWAKLNNVSFHGVEVKHMQTEDGIDKGFAVVATESRESRDAVSSQEDVEALTLIKVPADLILSLEMVETYAKSDRYLREVLDGIGEFGMTARGAILTYLLLLITHSSLEQTEYHRRSKEHIGVSNPWTEYIKFLPESFDLPTFYTPEEYDLLQGTSLGAAVDAKMDSLGREFELLRASTSKIPWCERDWWNEETGQLRFEDWKIVDAMYRSRALDMPGTGNAMVPCVDMANHASGEMTGAVYERDADENAVLQLRCGQRLQDGDEVTITYGDEKGACEMIFSYGFIEQDVDDARKLVLDLDISDDDPLKPAKRRVCGDAPGVALFTLPGLEQVIGWESDFVWWICINEEDGLDFRVLQSNEGERELKVFWKGEEFDGSHKLREKLEKEPMWDVFRLRAVVTIQDRVASQLAQLVESQQVVQEREIMVGSAVVRRRIWDTAMKLRGLEEEFLNRANQDLEAEKLRLLESKTVQNYLGSHQPGADISEDFS